MQLTRAAHRRKAIGSCAPSKEEAAPAVRLSTALIDIYRSCEVLFVFVGFRRCDFGGCRQCS